MILAGDVGGTKTNLAYAEVVGDSIKAVLIRSYSSRQYTSLGEVVARMLEEHPVGITAAAFGIAGPVVDGRSKLTNLGWDVDARQVAGQLKLNTVGLINDLEATAYGTLGLSDSEKVTINHGVPQARGNIAVIAAGTGLGEGGLVWNGTRYQAIASEGGHTDFGPRNETEIDLLRFLSKKFGRTSYERIIAGPAFPDVYEFFRSRASYPEPVWLQDQMKQEDASAVISKAGIEHKDEVCTQVLDLFVSLYGAEAGNLALKFLATGGVYIGGGIAPKILDKIREGVFLESFVRKGRYTNLLKHMPVYVITNDKTALLGAAHFARVMNG